MGKVPQSRMRSKSTQGKPVGWSNPDEWKRIINLLVRYNPKLKNGLKVDEAVTNSFLR